MDAKRFDAWTRRQLSLGAGAVAASLLGILGITDADSEAKSHGNNGKHKGKGKGRGKGKHHGKHHGKGHGNGPKCKKAGTGGCNTSRPDCCAGLTCQAVPGFGGVRCCAEVSASCTRDQQCCSGVCSGGACAFVS